MIRRAFIAALIGLLAVLVPALPANADQGAPITRFDVDVQLTQDGTANVTMDFTMDFGARSGRGPVLQFYTTQKDGENPDEEYVFDFSDPRVESATGARTNLSVDRGTNAVVWKIGHEDYVNRSPQDYTLTFTMKGMVAKNHPESKMDEFNWQMFSDVQSPIDNVNATIQGPVPVQKAACFQGATNRLECDSTVDNGTARMHLDDIPYGEGVQLVAGFPAGTFSAPEQVKRRVPTLQSNLTPGPVVTGAAGGLSIAALVGSWVLGRRAKRDLVYLGLTPGTVPPRGEEAPVGFRDTSKIPVAVQFQPPQDATPGEIGTLVDATADGIDVSATIVDLAVRGHLRIEPGPGKRDFTMHATPEHGDQLLPFERRLLNSIFAGSRRRTTDELKDKQFHKVMQRARNDLYEAMLKRKWFVSNPQTAGLGWMMLAGLSALVGVGLGMLLWEASLALVGLPFILLALGLFFVGASSKRRTARGSAMLQQARGFELYLRTAEADQIKFEEGIDVFSRYLPYAMIFGVADRWARVFEELEAAGRYRAETDWLIADAYYNAYFYSAMTQSFADSFSDSMMASAADYAAAQASSATSGGSGFGGGGGFGGGSIGSW